MKYKFITFLLSPEDILISGGATVPENFDKDDFMKELFNQSQVRKTLEEYEEETGETSICTNILSYSKEELLQKINDIEEMEGISRDKMTKLGNSSITNCTKSTFSEIHDKNETLHKKTLAILADLEEAPNGFTDILKFAGIPTDYAGIRNSLVAIEEKEKRESEAKEEDAQIKKVLEAFNDLPIAIQEVIKEIGIPTTEEELRNFDYTKHEDELLELVDMLLGGKR